jgi:hypothetical protein
VPAAIVKSLGGMAELAEVTNPTVTGVALAADMLTLKTTLVVSLSPSMTVASSIASTGGAAGPSSSRMRPVPVALSMDALTGSLRSTKNCSSPSSVVSPTTATVIV